MGDSLSCVGRGSVAGKVRRGPALPDQEESGGPHPETHAGKENPFFQAEF